MKIQFTVIALIGIIPLLAYCCQFGGTDSHLSDDPEDWAFFGDYIGGVYSVILTCLLTYLTYFLQKRGTLSKSRKDVIRELFSQINALNSVEKPDVSAVNNFTKLVIDSEILFYNEKEYMILLVITDYYKAIITEERVPRIELEIKKKLISMYNEYNNTYS